MIMTLPWNARKVFFCNNDKLYFQFHRPKGIINNLSAVNIYDLILVDHFSSLTGVKIPAPIFWTLLKNSPPFSI